MGTEVKFTRPEYIPAEPENLDTTPLELPEGAVRPEGIHEMVKRFIKSERMAMLAMEEGIETEEEANDFTEDPMADTMDLTSYQLEPLLDELGEPLEPEGSTGNTETVSDGLEGDSPSPEDPQLAPDSTQEPPAS